MKKILKIGGIVLVVLVILAAGLYVNQWVRMKMEKVRVGLSEPSFPYRDYTEEELGKMYPQIKYADVPTRVTPEQTYGNFRQALKDNDLEMAIAQLSRWASEERYQKNIETLTKAYNEEKFAEAYENYPEKIEKLSMSESIASYYYFRNEEGKDFRVHVSFTKDANGDWKLDSL